MADYVEKEAKTVEEAVELALQELQTDKDGVRVEVIEEGTKAVMGLFGGKDAKVRVTRITTPMETVTDFLQEIIDASGLEAHLEMHEEDDEIKVMIRGADVGSLIGRHGETLYAMQYVANLILNKGREEYIRVSLDVEDYKKNRQGKLEYMAKKSAERVLKYKRPVSMEPMPAFERKVVHTVIQEYEELESTSSGEEPRRYVVIKLKG